MRQVAAPARRGRSDPAHPSRFAADRAGQRAEARVRAEELRGLRHPEVVPEVLLRRPLVTTKEQHDLCLL